MAEAATETKPKRWYIVHAYSNFENKVADSIREQAKQRGLAHLFEEIMVPKEKVVEVRRGRKVDAERKFFPGYVLVKMDLTDEAYHLIKNTPKVTGFLGADKKPMPISEGEAQRIINQVQEGIERPKPSISFEVGEQVRVSDGPFASFNGTVEEVDEARSRAEGRGVDLRPRDAGGARIRAGREALRRVLAMRARALTSRLSGLLRALALSPGSELGRDLRALSRRMRGVDARAAHQPAGRRLARRHRRQADPHR